MDSQSRSEHSLCSLNHQSNKWLSPGNGHGSLYSTCGPVCHKISGYDNWMGIVSAEESQGVLSHNCIFALGGLEKDP